ncbi:aldo/keto reductase [Parapedobacter koreensis]|uniref:Predicted oxidoreductase n=1 Tax=Parapedobacter koreensis TaxID=332977 RepID=A0A1H7LTZ1_9SPHI|nr:aldo/keto reductase [Parapedobacter koreensis]SEL02400.1 Predicted oxidoreductase [Parapedobacter koreensis]
MEYRILGKSGLKVSTITLGTMTFGGTEAFAKVGNADVKQARSIIDLSIDRGVNLIDTANMYSGGLSEEIIGEVLDGKRPGDVLISSKARMPIGTGPNDEGFSRYHLIRECEKSLKRLRTDVIDIYYMHEWDGQTPLEEMLEALDTLVKQGKIRYIGTSNFSGWHTMKALATSRENGYQRFVTQQIHYTLEAREAEYELLPIGIDQGLGALIWSPLAGGLLSGKYIRESQPQRGTRFAEGWNEPPIRDWDRLWNIVTMLNEIAIQKNVSASQVAIAWILTRPSVSSVVIGGRTLEQIESNISAIDVQLTTDELQHLNEVSKLPLLYPYWHQANFAKNRLSEADKMLLGAHLS